MPRAPKSKVFKIPHGLVKHIPEQDLEAVEGYYNNASTQQILTLISLYLEEKLDMSVQDSEKRNKYDSPSWSEYQADNIGYRRALRELILLLTKE